MSNHCYICDKEIELSGSYVTTVRRKTRAEKAQLYWKWIKKRKAYDPQASYRSIRRRHAMYVRRVKIARKRYRRVCDEYGPESRKCLKAYRAYIESLQDLFDYEMRYVTMDVDREGNVITESDPRRELGMCDLTEEQWEFLMERLQKPAPPEMQARLKRAKQVYKKIKFVENAVGCISTDYWSRVDNNFVDRIEAGGLEWLIFGE